VYIFIYSCVRVYIDMSRKMRLTFKNHLYATRLLNNVVNGKWTTTHYTRKPREQDPRWKDIDMKRDSDEYDVLIVGGGPSGMSAAIRLKQLASEHNKGNYLDGIKGGKGRRTKSTKNLETAIRFFHTRLFLFRVLVGSRRPTQIYKKII
jgi:hypothetical protein